MMVADLQTPKMSPTLDEHSRRAPLLPSGKDNNNGVPKSQRKPKSRTVNSRYLISPSSSTSTSNSSSASSTSSSSRRFPSPLMSRNSTPVSNVPSLGLKRSISADRRRPAAARPLITDLESKNCSTEVSKLLVTTTRRLSVSFQGEAFTLPISKTKVNPPSPNLSYIRKSTPERRRSSTPVRGDHMENSKPSDHHHLWPARNRPVNPLSRSLYRNGGAKNEIPSIIDETRPFLGQRLSLDFDLVKNSELVNGNGNSVKNNELLMHSSDSDSVSSSSTSEAQECVQASNGLNGPRGGPFWQEPNTRLRRVYDPSSPQSKLIAPPKLKRYSSDGPSLRTTSSPIRGSIGPISPSKAMTPPSRAYSPARIRNAVSTISNSFVETPSVLSFAVDVRRGKVGENRIVDAHLLRLLYNRYLQWRFVNARSEGGLLVQEHNVEKNLWNAWITISDLRDTVTKKRHRLQLLRQKLKLATILKGQMTFLEDWSCMDKDHSISLLGAIEALKASTLRLPVVGGAIADVQSLKDAIGSSFEVMQAMTSSIFSLLPTIKEVNSLVTELAKVSTKEQALLEQCTDFISFLAAMQVKDSSLRTQVIQQNHLPSS